MRAILTYHSIDSSGSAISVSPDQFVRHVQWLASGRVRVVPLEELIPGGDSSDAVAITFDDGFASFEFAAEQLLARGLPATVFVVTGRVGTTNAWGGRVDPRIPQLPLMGWEALGRLAERGIRLGGHTRTHPPLAGLGPDRLEDEVVGCLDDLRDRLGITPGTFAYPYGAVSPEARAAVQATYDLAVTTELRMMQSHDSIHLLPRLDMFYYRDEGRLERWGTPAFRRHLWLRAGLRRARALVGGS